MSPLAKVFVVVNLVLSVCFFGTSATLFLTREDYRAKHEQFAAQARSSLDQLAEKIKEQKGLLLKQSEIIDHVTASEKQLADKGADLKSELRLKNVDITKANDARQEAQSQVVQKDKNIGILDVSIRELTQRLEQASEKAETAANERQTSVEERNRFKTDLDKVNAELAQMRVEYADLIAVRESQDIILTVYKRRFGDIPHPPPPAIDAQVEEVDSSLGLVVLSAGKEQKVEAGFEFTVYRKTKFVGKVRVTKVFDDLCGAEIVFTNEGVTVERGDRASTDVNQRAVLN